MSCRRFIALLRSWNETQLFFTCPGNKIHQSRNKQTLKRNTASLPRPRTMYRSPCQDLGLPGYYGSDGECNQFDSTDTATRNVPVVSHSESSDARLIPEAVSSSVTSISLMSSSSLSVPSKKRKSSLASSSSFLSSSVSKGDGDFSSFLLSLSDRTGLTMNAHPLRCQDIEEDCLRSLLSQRAAVFLDNKDQEQEQGRVQEVLVGSRSCPSPALVSSRKRNQEQKYEAAQQNMTLADRILRMHRNNDTLDPKESLLKSCTGPNPAATSKRHCSQQ